MSDSAPRILVFSTKGSGSNEESRIRDLLSGFSIDLYPFDRRQKLNSFRGLLRRIKETRPQLVVLEGTGLAGGFACFYSRLKGSQYVVSSGDAVAPWIGTRSRWLVWPFAVYERLLCRLAAGFIGWTPYLVGRALTYGTSRAMTAAGWSPFPISPEQAVDARAKVRSELGIAPDAIVIGIVGSLAWTARRGYCYGLELVKASQQVNRPEIEVLIVGDGDGMPHLKQAAAGNLKIHFTGNVPQEKTQAYMAAMDIASLPQSVDGVGSFRYTTKISEYLDAGLPIVTGQIPLAYDLGGDWLWRLPGDAPWDHHYIDALAALLGKVTREKIESARQTCPRQMPEFDRERQIARATQFIGDLLDRCDK